MVKGISSINGFIKTGVISALLAGSTALYASNPIKKEAQPNQTEVVSKEGAEALKSASLLELQQTPVTTEHNPRLDATFRKFAKNAEDKQAINEILNKIYKDEGTFLASAYIQYEMDRQMLKILLDENTDMLINNNINPKLGNKVKKFGKDFYGAVTPNAQKVTNWLENSYTPAIFSLIRFDHKPNGQELIKRLDYIAEEKANFDLDDMVEYHVFSDNFHRNELKNRTDNQALSDLAAYKMFMIDKLIIKNALYNHWVFDPTYKFNNGAILKDYYDEWMNSVEPKAGNK